MHENRARDREAHDGSGLQGAGYGGGFHRSGMACLDGSHLLIHWYVPFLPLCLLFVRVDVQIGATATCTDANLSTHKPGDDQQKPAV